MHNERFMHNKNCRMSDWLTFAKFIKSTYRFIQLRLNTSQTWHNSLILMIKTCHSHHGVILHCSVEGLIPLYFVPSNAIHKLHGVSAFVKQNPSVLLVFLKHRRRRLPLSPSICMALYLQGPIQHCSDTPSFRDCMKKLHVFPILPA